MADFGIARAVSQAGGEKLTQTGMAVGTPHYMSPEQSLGSEHVDARSDVYSLGCVLYELLIGQPPFTGPNAMAIMARHSMEVVPSLQVVRASVPDEVEDAVMQALEKTPADRFQTMQEFAERLSEAEAEAAMARTAQRRAVDGGAAGGERRPDAAATRAAGSRRRTPAELRGGVRTAASSSGRSWRGGLLLLAGLGFGVWKFTHREPAPAPVAPTTALDPDAHRRAVLRAAGRRRLAGLPGGRSHGGADPRAEQVGGLQVISQQRRAAVQEGRRRRSDSIAQGAQGGHAGRRATSASRATGCGSTSR